MPDLDRVGVSEFRGDFVTVRLWNSFSMELPPLGDCLSFAGAPERLPLFAIKPLLGGEDGFAIVFAPIGVSPNI